MGYNSWWDRILWSDDLIWWEKMLFRPIYILDSIHSWYLINIKYNLREVKYAYQRARYGHDELAVYNMNSWFIKNAIPIIDKWMEISCSFPIEFETHEEWMKVLEKMRKGFQHYYDVEMGEGKDRNPYTMIRTIKGEITCEDIPGVETATRWTFTPEEEAEFVEALTLFTKYFNTLWD